jgi:NADPH-dependent 2,4-dienoyl-CoA reductase/sulfur reductase-like enzyme
MKSFKYIIIGGGMTGDSAVKGIREIDKEGSIAVFSREPYKPYNRPPLTKDLWKGKDVEAIFRGTDEHDAGFFLSTNIASVDPGKNELLDDKGNLYKYEKLLLATGGEPIKLPNSGDKILYYRNLEDFKKLKALSELHNEFSIIGGGFIGTEIAAALAMNGKQVTMIFPEKLIGERVYPKELAEYITSFYRAKGVNIAADEKVKSNAEQDGKMVIKTESGVSIYSDSIIAGIGIRPSVQLAEKAGIETGNGVVVDEFLRTSIPNIFAAGDIANFYNPHLRKRVRIEHADNADKMGRHAGRNMAGEQEKYLYLPFFYSDMFELGYEALGELDSRHETVSDWKEPFRKGVVYYLDKGRVRGVLLLDTWGKVDEARELIGSGRNFTQSEFRGLSS